MAGMPPPPMGQMAKGPPVIRPPQPPSVPFQPATSVPPPQAHMLVANPPPVPGRQRVTGRQHALS